jgi:hypothetical protein
MLELFIEQTLTNILFENGLKMTSSRLLFAHPFDNTADIFTKNPTEEIFQKHAVKLVKTVPKGTEMCSIILFHMKTPSMNLNKMNGLK